MIRQQFRKYGSNAIREFEYKFCRKFPNSNISNDVVHIQIHLCSIAANYSNDKRNHHIQNAFLLISFLTNSRLHECHCRLFTFFSIRLLFVCAEALSMGACLHTKSIFAIQVNAELLLCLSYWLVYWTNDWYCISCKWSWGFGAVF